MSDEKPNAPSNVEVSGSGAAATAGGVAAGAAGLAIGGSVSGPIYFGTTEAEKTPVPRQTPRVPDYYVERPGDEAALRESLLDETGDKPLTLLFGWSGTGKTSLAARVVRNLPESAFPDGVLWGDLSTRNPNDQLSSFLYALDLKWRRAQPSNAQSRDVFWETLGGKRALIVLDNVKDAQQLQEILPADLGRCYLLAISIPRLSGLKLNCHEQRLGPFKGEEALTLFQTLLNKAQLESNPEVLREISERFDHLPQLVASAALILAEGKASPATYLRNLRQAESAGQVLARSASEGLEITLQSLRPEQVELFEWIGVLGEGDWHYKMLAAVALRPPAEVRQTLDTLVGNGLVESANNDRYRVNTLTHEFLEGRVRRQAEYNRQAAYHLLARYCLDVAQDIASTLNARSDWQDETAAVSRPPDEDNFARAFRDGLAPELSHIQRVLDWAVQCENWDLIRRFSYLPHMDLVSCIFAANARYLKLALNMATLRTPVIYHRRGNSTLNINISGDLKDFAVDTRGDNDSRCDLELNLLASFIADGVFEYVNFMDVHWIGVRTSNLIVKHADMVGSDFVACDFSHSVWKDCDARRANLLGSNLSHAVLRNVNLRGANLRDANLTGAVLAEVDLRGADLRGVNFAGARLRNLNLLGCKLDNVHWAGVRGSITATDDEALLVEEIKQASREPAVAGIPYEDYAPATLDLSKTRFPELALRGVDLCSADLSRKDLAEAKFGRVDLRAAILRRANLTQAQLGNVLLRATEMDRADCSEMAMGNVDLRAAELTYINFSRATMGNVNLRAAELSHATFDNAVMGNIDLQAADLSHASLQNVQLASANLIAADLAYANLAGAILADVKLTFANLASADLTGAKLPGTDLSGANLLNAICLNANFNNALLSEGQLAGARKLRGAIMTDGKRYDGRFKLAGDLGDARASGVNPDDEEEMRRFYEGDTNR